MLVEFSVENYQAFGAPQRVPIKPITLIFGPNGAGKSALLKSLLVSRHAVLEGKLHKSRGALDRHPGTFKAMQRNKNVPERFPYIQFGWTIQHAKDDITNSENLVLRWAEVSVDMIHIQRPAFYCNEKLFIQVEDYKPIRIGSHLDGKLNAFIDETLGNLPLKGEDRSVLHEKIKETLLRELELDHDSTLFPGSDDKLYAFYFEEGLPDKLQKALSGDIPNTRRRTKLIKKINEVVSDLLPLITDPLLEFHKKLTTELNSLVYHGPIRPVYDEIKSTDISDSQMSEWLNLAGDPDLRDRVNNWLASTAGNQNMKIRVSPTLTMHDLEAAGFENINWDDILKEAYARYIFGRHMVYTKLLIYWDKTPSTVTPDRLQVLLEWVADRLAHDGSIGADLVADCDISLPAHYRKGADGEYSADVSAFPPHLRHPETHPEKAYLDYLTINEEQKLAAARAYFALCVGRGETKRIEDFLPGGMNALLSEKVHQLKNTDQNTDLHKVLFIDSRTNKAVQASNLGLGFSQMLPLVISAFACEDQLIAIEQPELHVHPALQTELADLFIQSAMERKNRFLIETHSEHLILRVMRRIRETTRNLLPEGKHPIRPEDVAVLYVQPGENGSTVQELRIDEQGRFLDNWPQGFFEERLDEMF